jgi:hypothetical protein
MFIANSKNRDFKKRTLLNILVAERINVVGHAPKTLHICAVFCNHAVRSEHGKELELKFSRLIPLS